jgi:hypothetical protein
MVPGGTLVKFTDGGWPDGDARLRFCNTRWGEVLIRLKEYLEKGLLTLTKGAARRCPRKRRDVRRLRFPTSALSIAQIAPIP